MRRFSLTLAAGLAPAFLWAATLPVADDNGDRSPYIRTIYRAADTVDAAYTATAHQLPATCDDTMIAGDDMTDFETAINNTANDSICINAGVDLGATEALFTRTVCPNPIFIMRSDYAAFAPNDYTQHVANIADGSKAKIGAVEFRNGGDCLVIFYGLYHHDIFTAVPPTPFPGALPSIGCQAGGTTTARWIVSHAEVHGGLFNESCRGTQYGVHYSVLTTDNGYPNEDRECVRSGNNVGGTLAGEGTWITHNEIRDCYGDWIVSTSKDQRQDGGLVVMYNDGESTSAHKTDCVGNQVDDDTRPCHAGENWFDIKNGNTGDTLTPYAYVVGNRVRGWRSNDDGVGGSGGGATAVFDLQQDSYGAVVRDNIVWNSHHGVRASNKGTLNADNVSAARHSVVGNIFALKSFDVDLTEAWCTTQGGGVNCSGFNVGWRVNNITGGRFAFNTMVWDAALQPINWIELGGRDNQVIGNLIVGGGTPDGTQDAGWEVDCNAYENTTSLTDATVSSSNTFARADITLWVDPITNPRQVTIQGVTRTENVAAAADLCSGVTIDVTGFGNSNNDGIANNP